MKLQRNRPKISTAPLLKVSDRHARYFWRLLSKQALLYTEMINMGAVCRGVTESHLRHRVEEYPLALQLGGSSPSMLAESARIAEQWGYQEINLNCGCPSDRVQSGSFGACLMRTPSLVVDCVKAMQDAVTAVPITVKHRIGLDRDESYDMVCDFVGALANAGCKHFIVHARNAWLQGLSPKENRDIPPLKYDVVYRIKRDFPQLHITLNGGVATAEQIKQHWQHVDAVMIGRAAWHTPWTLSQWDKLMQPHNNQPEPQELTRELVEQQMVQYMECEAIEYGTPWPSISRCMLGLRHGLRGARHWRRIWSDQNLKHLAPQAVMEMAHDMNFDNMGAY